jgi:hypothetical protein
MPEQVEIVAIGAFIGLVTLFVVVPSKLKR